MLLRPRVAHLFPLHSSALVVVSTAVLALGCANSLDGDDDEAVDEPTMPAVVITEGDEPVSGSDDAAISYTFEVDLQIEGQLYVIGRSQYDGPVNVISPAGAVEPFDRWSSTRSIDVTGPRATFVAVMQGDTTDVIEELVEHAMVDAGPVCSACGFECRVLAPSEVGCQPLCSQCDAQAVLGGRVVVQAPISPNGPYHDDEYPNCNPRTDCQ